MESLLPRCMIGGEPEGRVLDGLGCKRRPRVPSIVLVAGRPETCLELGVSSLALLGSPSVGRDPGIANGWWLALVERDMGGETARRGVIEGEGVFEDVRRGMPGIGPVDVLGPALSSFMNAHLPREEVGSRDGEGRGEVGVAYGMLR